MKKVTVQILGSLGIGIVLSLISFDKFYLVAALLFSYALVKAMNYYYKNKD